MQKLINSIFQFISFRLIGRDTTKKGLQRLFRAFDLNMLEVAHNQIGINKYGNNIETGEDFFLRQYIFEKFKNGPITVFDVGANVGKYSLMIKEIFPAAEIYAFEPNPVSCKLLFEKTNSIKNINPYCLGLGATKSNMEIYTYKNDQATEHASIIKNVMVELHKSEEVENFKIDIIDLDSFCQSHSVRRIHFLKIDTEGFELEVLKGAQNLLKDNAIEIIQFEFNEMNVFSKVFLHDFYTILPKFNFYRLDKHKLIPLGKYNASNEIFKYQNIVALSS